MLVKKVFEGGVAIRPDNYSEIEKTVTQQNNIIYPSSYPDNMLDIISPKEIDIAPVIIWVHGGAFVAGDKSDITEYAVQIAAQGYHVVNINYALAPNAKYPTPLLQLADAYQFVIEHADTYGFDTKQIIFAGDSAGAQIVSQFANIQTNADYAQFLNIAQSVPSKTIKGVLLYCGPYDIQQLSTMSDNKLLAFLLNRVGWGYIGERKWQTSELAAQASPIDYATSNYPPTFITDGTVMTFDDHGKAFVHQLKTLGVDVTDKFFEGVELPHEYQFMMDRPESIETLQATIGFLQNKTEKH